MKYNKINNLLKAILFVVVLGAIVTAGNVVVKDGSLNATSNVTTPELCLSGDCQTNWPSGGGVWNDTGTDVILNNPGDSVCIDCTDAQTNLQIGGSVSTSDPLLGGYRMSPEGFYLEAYDNGYEYAMIINGTNYMSGLGIISSDVGGYPLYIQDSAGELVLKIDNNGEMTQNISNAGFRTKGEIRGGDMSDGLSCDSVKCVDANGFNFGKSENNGDFIFGINAKGYSRGMLMNISAVASEYSMIKIIAGGVEIFEVGANGDINTTGGIEADNGNFYYDATTNKLGLLNRTPGEVLDVNGNVRADSYIEYSNIFTGDALSSIKNILEEAESCNENDWCEVEHSSLPSELQHETIVELNGVNVTQIGRNLGNSVQYNLRAIQQLLNRIEALELEVAELKG